jgi:hypothetical protein
MEKEILQKAILNRAAQKVKNEINSFFKICNGNRILSQLKIKNIKNGNNFTTKYFCGSPGDSKPICISLGSGGYIDDDTIANTNLQDICNKLLDEYIKEEENLILDKIRSLDYLFNNIENI